MGKCLKRMLLLCLSMLVVSGLFGSASFAANEIEPYYRELQEDPDGKLLSGVDDITVTAANVMDGEQDNGAVLLDSAGSSGYGKGAVSLAGNGQVSYRVEVPEAGGYHIKLDYYIPGTYMQDLILSLKINGGYQFYESRNIELKAAWKDESKEYVLDKYGNEIYPNPVRVFRWQNKFLNSVAYNLATPYVFELKQGVNILTVATGDVPVVIGDITLTGKQAYQSFDDYTAGIKDQSIAAVAVPVIIEGEAYWEKSDSYIRSARSNDQNFYPYAPSKKRINTLAGSTWRKANQNVTYSFDIEKPGVYYIAVKYMQDDKENMPAYKRIYVDGSILFEDLLTYRFDYTGRKPANRVISADGEKVGFYFTEGSHTITFESTAETYAKNYENLTSVINDVNRISLEIKYITGNKTDRNRDWKIEKYIPGLKDRLVKNADILAAEYEKLDTTAATDSPALISDLKVAEAQLRKFSRDLNYLVNNLDQFSIGDSSVVGLISGILPELLDQPVTIDRLYITPDVSGLPRPTAGFFTNVVEGVKKLVLSFFNAYDTQEVKKDRTVSVWVNHAVTNVEILRQMIKSDFLPGKDYDIDVSIMPDEQKLLMAVSAGNAPDVAVGLTYYKPFQFALRGALYDLTRFKDFGGIIDEFNPEFFVPFTIGDSCYAVPEALNFNLLYYRKDILSQLGLEVPKTWDDVVAMLPALSRYGMSFGSQIATAGSMKNLGTTYPFITQFNGKIYSEDGARVDLGNPNTIKAFKLMTDLYTKYSMPETVANFYDSFMKGTTPIGVSDMTTYVLLRHAAPEIAGQWGIAPVVGVADGQGGVNNTMWGVYSASSILADTDMPEESWDFLQWFMSEKVQTSYVNGLQMTFGPEFIWASANLKAFANTTAYSKEHMEVLLEQLSNAKEIPLHPAFIIVEREISDAWNRVVFNGMAPRTSLDQAITRSNREISKKLKEFGYLDENNKPIKPFVMPTVETVLKWKE